MKQMVLVVYLLAFTLVGCTSVGGRTLNAGDHAVVDSAIDDAVSGGAFPFLYVRVEKLDGDLVYEHSAINPEFAPHHPTGDSWMRLWSMSKSVTIATILDLEEDGLLSRADLVTDYIPEFSGLTVLIAEDKSSACSEGRTLPNRSITIEDLLNHNDGFYYPFTEFDCLNEAMNQARLPEASSSNDLINRIAALPLHPDGVGEHQYGIGTTILGLVAERATGRPFGDIVEQRITGPLGISETLRYALPENQATYPRITGADGALRLAEEGELDIFGGPVPQYRPDVGIFLGGVGMVGTTRGYAKFLRLMGGHGELDGIRILEEDTVRDWYSPKTQLDSVYGKNGFNIWVTSGKFDGLPDQKPGLLVGGGYEGTAFWIDVDSGYVGLIMSQVHMPATGGVDDVSRIRGLIYEHILQPGPYHNNRSAAKNAKNPPIANALTATHQRIQLILRNRMQARAFTGSMGQGRFLARDCQVPDMVSTRAATANTMGLFAPIHVIPGTVSISPAMTAPMPTLTSNAGRAQQISVENDVNSARVAGIMLGDRTSSLAVFTAHL